MNCPYCNFDESKVIDSRDAFGSIKRRRHCLGCNVRFTTYEKVHLKSPLMVVKANGGREPFAHNKLEKSIRIACVKRNLSSMDIDRMVAQIETTLYKMGNREVASNTIGSVAMEILSTTDRIAYIRYASVYRDFQDEQSFADVVEELKGNSTVPTSQMSLEIDDNKQIQHPKTPVVLESQIVGKERKHKVGNKNSK